MKLQNAYAFIFHIAYRHKIKEFNVDYLSDNSQTSYICNVEDDPSCSRKGNTPDNTQHMRLWCIYLWLMQAFRIFCSVFETLCIPFTLVMVG